MFDDDRFFDVVVEYAKDGPDEVLMRIRATNAGPDPAPLHLMPTVWFRNTWSWDATATATATSERPSLRLAGEEVVAEHDTLGRYRLAARTEGAHARWLFTENETGTKDAFHRTLVDGDAGAANPKSIGTKAALDARWVVPPGQTVELVLAMVADGDVPPQRLLERADFIFGLRATEADEFYAALAWPTTSPNERLVQRQALAGILWSLQYYAYDVALWRAGDGVPPPAAHAATRNADWGHLRTGRVLSVPDTWEYPWFAAWDLAFQTVILNFWSIRTGPRSSCWPYLMIGCSIPAASCRPTSGSFPIRTHHFRRGLRSVCTAANGQSPG